jgi:hypothetical protein
VFGVPLGLLEWSLWLRRVSCGMARLASDRGCLPDVSLVLLEWSLWPGCVSRGVARLRSGGVLSRVYLEPLE